MTLKLSFAIRDEQWYPSNRMFTDFEARIDLLIEAGLKGGIDKVSLIALAERWEWSILQVNDLIDNINPEDFIEVDRASKRKADAQAIVDIYNSVFDRKVQLNDYRIRTISARIKEKNGPSQFKAVFEHMKEEWTGTEQEKYLTLETLCAAKHFLKYLESARAAYRNKNKLKNTEQNGQRMSGNLFKTA
jgi:uncharacterized phage protein (TIGR02220 family)